MSPIGQFISILAQVLSIAIFLRAMLSWFPAAPRDNFLISMLFQVTDPVLQPIRRIIPPVGMLDITPIVAIIILQIIGSVAQTL